MLAEEITLVGDIDYDRILGQPLFIEETQQALLQLAMKAYGDDDENFSG